MQYRGHTHTSNVILWLILVISLEFLSVDPIITDLLQREQWNTLKFLAGMGVGYEKVAFSI